MGKASLFGEHPPIHQVLGLTLLVASIEPHYHQRKQDPLMSMLRPGAAWDCHVQPNSTRHVFSYNAVCKGPLLHIRQIGNCPSSLDHLSICKV